MVRKDPNKQVLKAYYDMLTGQIVYDGSEVKVGTRIPRSADNYVHIFIEDISILVHTDDQIIYNIVVALEIVSLQDAGEGSEAVVNSILEQLLNTLDEDSLIMTGFRCSMLQYGDMDYIEDTTEKDFRIVKKLRTINFIEQL